MDGLPIGRWPECSALRADDGRVADWSLTGVFRVEGRRWTGCRLPLKPTGVLNPWALETDNRQLTTDHHKPTTNNQKPPTALPLIRQTPNRRGDAASAAYERAVVER